MRRKRTNSAILVLVVAASIGQLASQTWTWDAATPASHAQSRICRDLAGDLYMTSTSISSPDTLWKISATGQALGQIVFPPTAGVVAYAAAPDTGVFVTGAFTGTMTFANSTYSASGNYDIWLAHFSRNGSLVWMKTISSSGEDRPGGLCMTGNRLVITGTIEDTVNFMGQQMAKPHEKDLFVATVTTGGFVQNIKFATGITTASLDAYSAGGDCGADAAGNIYVVSTAAGINKMDTFSLSFVGQWDTPWERTVCQRLIRFTPSLQAVSVTSLTQGYYYWYPDYNLRVSAAGDCYLVNTYSYGQSGNDDLWSTIKWINSSGVLSGTFQPRHDRNSYISDIELDCFGNLYFCGYTRPHTDYVNPFKYSSLFGQLSSSLAVTWLKQDSLNPHYRCANAMAVLGSNDLFLAGTFQDTVQFVNILVCAPNDGGFFARLTASPTASCIVAPPNTTGFNGTSTNVISFFPNPSNGRIYFQDAPSITDITVFSAAGEQMLQSSEPAHGLDVSQLPDGIYVLTASSRSGKKITKLIVAR